MPVSSEDMVRRLGKSNPGISSITDKPRHSSRMCVEDYTQRVMQFLLTVCSFACFQNQIGFSALIKRSQLLCNSSLSHTTVCF